MKTLLLLNIITLCFSTFCNNVGCGQCETEVCITCKIGYDDNDDSCEKCDYYISSKKVDQLTNPVYLNIEDQCIDISNKIQGKEFNRMPVNSSECTLDFSEKFFSFDMSEVTPSIPPCINTSQINDYLFGKWTSITLTEGAQMNIYNIKILNSNQQIVNKEISMQVSNIVNGQMNCLASSIVSNDEPFSVFLNSNTFILFIGLLNGVNYTISFNAKASIDSDIFHSSLVIDGNDYIDFIDYTDNYTSFGKPQTMVVGEKDIVIYQMKCSPIIRKGIFFSVKTVPYHTLILDTKLSSSFHYVEEIDINTFSCKQLHIGKKGGLTTTEGSSFGVLFKVYSEKEELRHFFMSIENDPLTLRIQTSCVNKCNQDNGYGQCVISEFKCVCNEGYGFEDCSRLCYYDGKFNTTQENPCYLGTPGCDKHCKCKEGYSYQDHYCISKECLNLGIGSCNRNNKHCLLNCECEDGYELTQDKMCKLKTCGNQQKNEFEECDGGLNCNDFCECNDGFTTDPNDPLSCKETGIFWWHILLIIIGS
ncbi:protein kinase domain containing protein, partial [Entamoeba nuttalli P19]